jgi:RNA-splicing ligase RtcB
MGAKSLFYKKENTLKMETLNQIRLNYKKIKKQNIAQKKKKLYIHKITKLFSSKSPL